MKKRIFSAIVITWVMVIVFPGLAKPCTTFLLQRGKTILFGRNLDWVSGTGLLTVNPRDVAKIALVDSIEPAIRWVSKFGSITFNQIGRELPFGGMNEKGLVVEHMTLDSTRYPQKDTRYPISAFQWIQYQLDNNSTVNEVLRSDSFLRIEDPSVKIHFLVSDRFGHAATIEFLNGKMVYHTGASLPFAVLANNTYAESMDCYNHPGTNIPNPSLIHFCTIAKAIHSPNPATNSSSIHDAFQILQKVSQGLFTKWSIVYDPIHLKIYFKIYETPVIVGNQKIFLKQPPYDPAIKIVSFASIDFDCASGAKVFDLNSNQGPAVNPYLVKYTASLNKEFISRAFTFYAGWGLPIKLKDKEIEYLAMYPEKFTCASLCIKE